MHDAGCLRLGELPGHPGSQADHGQDVKGVVGEDRFQRRGVPGLFVLEVQGRNQPAGDIPFPEEAQDTFLQAGQTATGQALFPQPASRRQQIEVRGVLQRELPAPEDEARVQQRQIEGLAVERDDSLEILEPFIQ